MHGDAIKDEKGLPPNIVPPAKPRWIVEVHQVYWWWPWFIGAGVHWQSYDDIKHAYGGGAFVHKWWTWHLEVRVLSRVVHFWRWHERWAV